MAIAAILIVLAVILVIWGIGVQNKLVKADEISKNALKQINVQQVSRFDALKALVKLTREYAEYEGKTLTDVIGARNIARGGNPSVDDINKNEAMLSKLTTQVMAVAEQYPNLKASEGYTKTMNDIKSYEENVRLARMTFNDTVTRFNNQVRMFPGSIVASLLHFPPKEYLAEDTSKTEYPDII
ncbi:MAG: LemA family protein [Bacteroidales bacterium]|nr:LemA family protein [Bacteroidales bacterium]